MFDLNEQIIKWRSQLEANEAYQKADIEELESHLLDEIDQLKKKDLNEEEAFWISAHRIGKLKDLNQEFHKVNSKYILKNRLLLFLGGYLFLTFLQNFLQLPAQFFSDFSSYLLIGLDITMKIVILSGLIFLMFSNKFLRYLEKKFHNLKIYHYILILIPVLALVLLQVYGFAIFVKEVSLSYLIKHFPVINVFFEPVWFVILFIAFILTSFSLIRNKKKLIIVN